MKIKLSKGLGLLLMLALLLAACGGNDGNNNGGNDGGNTGGNSGNSGNTQSDDSGSSDSGGDTSTGDMMSLSSLDVNLDPALATDEDSLTVASYLYSTLVGFENGEAVAELAAVWEVSDDGLDYVFTLRGDASFSDGTPVTTDAVIANFERWFDKDNDLHGSDEFASWETYFYGFKGEKNDDGTAKSIFDGIEKVDNVTFLIHLNDQYPDFLEVISMAPFSILNPDTLASGDYVGSGAYVLGSMSDSSIVLEPNASYFGGVPSGNLEFGAE